MYHKFQRKGYHRRGSSIQLAVRFFFRFPLFSPELGGELLMSDALPGVSTLTCGVDTRPAGLGVLAAVPSPALDAG